MSDRLPRVLLQDRQSQGADYCERERRLEERAAGAEQQVASLQALLQGTNSKLKDPAGMGHSFCSWSDRSFYWRGESASDLCH